MKKNLIKLAILLETQELGGLKKENGWKITSGEKHPAMAKLIYPKVNGLNFI